MDVPRVLLLLLIGAVQLGGHSGSVDLVVRWSGPIPRSFTLLISSWMRRGRDPCPPRHRSRSSTGTAHRRRRRCGNRALTGPASHRAGGTTRRKSERSAPSPRSRGAPGRPRGPSSPAPLVREGDGEDRARAHAALVHEPGDLRRDNARFCRPAPARMRSGPPSWITACRCSALSFRR